jgi:hypothetical protein
VAEPTTPPEQPPAVDPAPLGSQFPNVFGICPASGRSQDAPAARCAAISAADADRRFVMGEVQVFERRSDGRLQKRRAA